MENDNKFKKFDKMDENHSEKGRFKKGNKVAEKWTYLKTRRKLNELLEILIKDQTQTNADGELLPPTIYIIPDLCIKSNVSSRWLRNMELKFVEGKHPEHEVEAIQELIQNIKDVMESRVWNATSQHNIDNYLGIFTLKAYHNKVERQHIQTENENTNTHKGDVKLNIIFPEDK